MYKSEKRFKIKIYGIVQGVFFRAYARDVAIKLGIKGYVRNMPDGSVEIVAQGREDKLKELIDSCKKGPPKARVDRIEVREEKSKADFYDFSVIY